MILRTNHTATLIQHRSAVERKWGHDDTLCTSARFSDNNTHYWSSDQLGVAAPHNNVSLRYGGVSTSAAIAARSTCGVSSGSLVFNLWFLFLYDGFYSPPRERAGENKDNE